MARTARLALGGWVVVANLALSTSAAAEPETHDGLQVRLGLGAAYMTSTVGTEPASASLLKDASMSGAGVAGMILIGGTVAPGLVIGGGGMGAHIFKPKVKATGFEGDADNDVGAQLFGVYGDYYLDPTGGLHFLAMLGAASLASPDKSSDVAFGFGAGAGVGYEAWVSDEWSLGGLLRVHYQATRFDEGNNVDSVYGTLVPALLFTATYH